MRFFEFITPIKTVIWYKKIRIHPKFSFIQREVTFFFVLIFLVLFFWYGVLFARSQLKQGEYTNILPSVSSVFDYESIVSHYKTLDMEALIQGDFREVYTRIKQDMEQHIPSLFWWIFPSYKEVYASIDDMLGMRMPHDIILWLQNDHELRPGGGFIGSYIRVRLEEGVITSWSFHDIYDADNQIINFPNTPMIAEKLVGNEPWSLRDATVFPDFSKSAQQFLWFLEQAGHPSAETVIALRLSFIERLLEIVGTVPVLDDTLRITPDALGFVLSYFIEGKYTSYPKSIIIDIAKQLLKDTNMSFDTIVSMIPLLPKVSMYSQLPRIQSFFQTFELQGEVYTPHEMHLQTMSISGNKSDAFVSEKVTYTCLKVHCTVQFFRFHGWGGKQESSYSDLQERFPLRGIDADTHKNLLGKGGNRRVFQFIVPPSVKNVEATGMHMRTYHYEQSLVYEWVTDELFPETTQSFSFSFDNPGIPLSIPYLYQYYDEYSNRVEQGFRKE